MAENPTAGVVQEEEEDNLEYDSDGNPIAPSKKIIDPLPPIDHSEVCCLLLFFFSKLIMIFSFNIRFSQYLSTSASYSIWVVVWFGGHKRQHPGCSGLNHIE